MVNEFLSAPALRLAGCFLLAVVCGCRDDGPPLVEAAGMVTLNGKPLPQGHISFDPADGAGSAYAADVEQGRFALRLEPGRKQVSIRASRPANRPGPDGGPDFEQYLPPQYNVRSVLQAEIRTGEASALQFDLKSE